MTSVFLSSLPGLVLSMVCMLFPTIYAIIFKDKLPENCVSRFDFNFVPTQWMSRDAMFWTTILLPIGMTIFLIILGIIMLATPAKSFQGIDLEYYKYGARKEHFRAMIMNMMYIMAAIISLFFLSVMIPSWQYNMNCEIVVGTPMPCDYKMHVLPQIIILSLLVVLVIVWFTMSFKRKPESVEEMEYWKCGICYVNADNENVCVPKRLGVGWTINLGHACGIAICIAIIMIPVIIFLYSILFV